MAVELPQDQICDIEFVNHDFTHSEFRVALFYFDSTLSLFKHNIYTKADPDDDRNLEGYRDLPGKVHSWLAPDRSSGRKTICHLQCAEILGFGEGFVGIDKVKKL